MKLFLLILAGAAGLLAADLKSAVKAYESHDYAGAQKALESVIASEPGNASAHAYLALVQVERDKGEAAAESARKATELSGDCAEAKVAQARIEVENGNMSAARKLLDQSLDANPDDSLALYHRGQLRLREDDYKGAAADLDRAAEVKPSMAYAYYYAGLAYSKTNQPDKMVARYQSFLKMKPDAPEAAKIRALLRGVR